MNGVVSIQAFDAVNQLNEMEDVTAPLPAWDHFAQMWLGWAKRDGASIVPQKVKAEAAIEAIVGQRCVDLNALGGVRLTGVIGVGGGSF